MLTGSVRKIVSRPEWMTINLNGDVFETRVEKSIYFWWGANPAVHHRYTLLRTAESFRPYRYHIITLTATLTCHPSQRRAIKIGDCVIAVEIIRQVSPRLPTARLFVRPLDVPNDLPKVFTMSARAERLILIFTSSFSPPPRTVRAENPSGLVRERNLARIRAVEGKNSAAAAEARKKLMKSSRGVTVAAATASTTFVILLISPPLRRHGNCQASSAKRKPLIIYIYNTPPPPRVF